MTTQSGKFIEETSQFLPHETVSQNGQTGMGAAGAAPPPYVEFEILGPTRLRLLSSSTSSTSSTSSIKSDVNDNSTTTNISTTMVSPDAVYLAAAWAPIITLAYVVGKDILLLLFPLALKRYHRRHQTNDSAMDEDGPAATKAAMEAMEARRTSRRAPSDEPAKAAFNCMATMSRAVASGLRPEAEAVLLNFIVRLRVFIPAGLDSVASAPPLPGSSAPGPLHHPASIRAPSVAGATSVSAASVAPAPLVAPSVGAALDDRGVSMRTVVPPSPVRSVGSVMAASDAPPRASPLPHAAETSLRAASPSLAEPASARAAATGSSPLPATPNPPAGKGLPAGSKLRKISK
ncbi:MAG: hypothetical protein M1829_003024 [Trizodia sp. TS-e1964]|nr:MAG: hypothetical protein M1829_003024 [Trizodia sp. TS-e1964]